MNANITCPRAGCHGEFEFVAGDPGDALYQCEQCDEFLSQTSAERVAEGDSLAAELARVLLDGGEV
jgi:gas vesicle GvpC-like protein